MRAVGLLVAVMALAGCTPVQEATPVPLPAACELAAAPHATESELRSLADRLAQTAPTLSPITSARDGDVFGKVLFAHRRLRSAADKDLYQLSLPVASRAPEPSTVDSAQEELANACAAFARR